MKLVKNSLMIRQLSEALLYLRACLHVVCTICDKPVIKRIQFSDLPHDWVYSCAEHIAYYAIVGDLKRKWPANSLPIVI